MNNQNNIVTLWPKWSYSSVVADGIIIPNSGITRELITIPKEMADLVIEIAWKAFASSLWNLNVIKRIPSSWAWIIPVHNTYWGTVNITPEAIYELWKNKDLKSFWWYSLKIKHILAWKEWTNLENLTSIHSHQQAIEQCRNEGIKRLNKWINLVSEQSTTAHIPDLKTWEAVICNRQAAEWANLIILDDSFWPKDNITDFIVLSVNEEMIWLQNLTNHKAMLILSLINERWSLVKCLALLSDAWIDVNTLHSQTKIPWETDFIVVADNIWDWDSISRELKKQWWKIKIL